MSVPLGGPALDDPAALAWLAEEVRRHTAGNGPGISIAQTMQNYHGIQALARLAAPDALPHNVRVVFAGGTCLALGHRLIERYSEDIDIVLVPSAHLESAQRDDVLDAVDDIIAGQAGLSESKNRRGPHFQQTVMAYDRTIEPATVPNSALVFKADIGFAAHLDPAEIATVDVETYLSLRGNRTYASQFGDLRHINVSAVKPHVTLMEKLIALHQRAAANQRRGLMRRSRDVFDIGYLLQHTPTLEALDEHGTVASDIDARQAPRAATTQAGTHAAERLSARRPPTGFADSPVWQHGHPMSAALRQAYDSNISRLAYDRTKVLTFEEVTALVHQHRDRL